MTSTIKIKDKEYIQEEVELDYRKLKFYKENPRIYSVMNIDGYEPSQEEIEEKMCSLDHVRKLKTSIMEYGGLADPIYVRDGTFEVLEGNSRLAAYRLINKSDPSGKWKNIRCYLLPSDISEESIRALLGTLHLVGRTDWSPYEQAGYLYRIKDKESVSEDALARELGLEKRVVKQQIKVFTFMKDNEDLLPEHWSYYDEYIKSASIRKKRKLFPKLDEKFCEHVKGNKIKQAKDVRDYLGAALKVEDTATDEAINRFLGDEYDIYDIKNMVDETGKNVDSYKLVNKFRMKICDQGVTDSIINNYDSNMSFELDKIIRQIERIKNKAEGSKK